MTAKRHESAPRTALRLRRATVPVALFTALAAVYWRTMPPGVTFEDAALLAAVCNTLGIAHPPGYPLHTLSCAPVSWLAQAAGADPVRGAALASALAAAAACAVFFTVLAKRFRTPAALAAAGAWGLSTLMWHQAVIPEVYGLNCLLAALSFALVDAYCDNGGPNKLMGASLTAGLGLANSWPLFLLFGPVLILWLAPARARLAADLRNTRTFASCLALFMAGLALYSQLLLSPGDSVKFLGDVRLESFASYVSREHFTVPEQGNDFPRWDQRSAAAASTLAWIPAAFTALGGIAGLIGLAMLAGSLPAARRLALAWGLLAPTFVVAMWRPHLAQSEHSVAIYQAYPLTALMLFAFGLAAATAAALARLPLIARFPAALALLAAMAAWQWPHTDRSGDDIAARYVSLAYNTLPRGATVVHGRTSYAFPLRYGGDYLPDGAPRRDDLAFVTLAELEAGGGRPVFADMFLQGSPFGKSVVGALHRRFPGEPDRPPQLDGEALGFYRRLLGHGLGATSIWTAEFARRLIFELVLADARARRAGWLNPGGEYVRLLDDLRLSAPGKFARLTEQVGNGLGPEATLVAIGALGNPEEQPGQWRADILHMAAAARLKLGHAAAARDLLERSLAAYPARDNRRALSDLLALFAVSGDMAAYARLRARYPGFEAPFLAALDRQCAAALDASCAPAQRR